MRGREERASKVICGVCGQSNSDRAKYCKSCNRRLAKDIRIRSIKADARTIPQQTTTPTSLPQAQQPTRSPRHIISFVRRTYKIAVGVFALVALVFQLWPNVVIEPSSPLEASMPFSATYTASNVSYYDIANVKAACYILYAAFASGHVKVDTNDNIIDVQSDMVPTLKPHEPTEIHCPLQARGGLFGESAGNLTSAIVRISVEYDVWFWHRSQERCFIAEGPINHTQWSPKACSALPRKYSG